MAKLILLNRLNTNDISDQNMLISSSQPMGYSLVQKEGLKCLFSFLKFIGEYGGGR